MKKLLIETLHDVKVTLKGFGFIDISLDQYNLLFINTEDFNQEIKIKVRTDKLKNIVIYSIINNHLSIYDDLVLSTESKDNIKNEIIQYLEREGIDMSIIKRKDKIKNILNNESI